MSFVVHFSITLPKPDAFRSKKWKENIMSTLRARSQTTLRGLFEQTTKGWSPPKPYPKFDYVWEGSRAVIDMYAAGARADIWNLVSAGSPKHHITPKKQGGLLKFRPGYKSATTPGELMSSRAYRSGKYVSVPRVKMDGQPHPGFAPRNFPDLITREFERHFIDQMQDAFNEAARGK